MASATYTVSPQTLMIRKMNAKSKESGLCLACLKKGLETLKVSPDGKGHVHGSVCC